jgi:hypothetical protein
MSKPTEAEIAELNRKLRAAEAECLATDIALAAARDARDAAVDAHGKALCAVIDAELAISIAQKGHTP